MKLKHGKVLAGLLTVGQLLVMGQAQAKLFRITPSAGASALEIQALTALEDLVNKQHLPDVGTESYLEGMANAGTMTTKGMGVDYASNQSLFVVGLSAGVGADVGGNSLGDLIGGDVDADQMRGVGINGSLMAGVNLGIFSDSLWFFDLHRANAYINFFKKSDLEISDITADFSNLGLHLQYKVIEPMDFGLGMFKWGGVDVSVGYEYGKMDLTYSQQINESYTLDGSGIAGNFTGPARLNIATKSSSLPLEASTNVRLFYFLTLYGGLASDISWGESKGTASVSGPVTLNGVEKGTASLELGPTGKPDAFLLRGFAGTQFNILMAKIFIHLNKGFTNDTVGLSAGVRVAW